MTDRRVTPHDDTGTATSLLARAAARQVDAWEKLVSLYGPLIYRWCRRWGLQASDAENVGQEVFIRVASGLGEFHGNQPGDTFRGWLYRITHNCFVDHLRRRDASSSGSGGSDARERLERLSASPAEYADDPAMASQDDALLYRQLVEFIRNEFSDRDWTAFYRVVIDGIAPAEAAEELNVSVNVIYLAKSRVLRRVREEFAGLIPAET
ncbi:MAG TPA: sigma-70 family RNA polymerase sigma factor [Pirellulaceae bacterium]|nr:sigma-70 family RNA polymerase sigma factor [Pirellulaceae bacterium]